ncbi:MAG: hypothetical protein DME24_19620 [Verrucomicrobia bacterium]|nr:MAG: hypothetical protein DME24_19620 [Verrucomicrobiota bacterium]
MARLSTLSPLANKLFARRRARAQFRFGQPASELSATEWRKMVAHGVSRGEPCGLAKSPVRGDRVVSRRTFFRRFAAPIFNTQTHG